MSDPTDRTGRILEALTIGCLVISSLAFVVLVVRLS